MLTRVRFAIVMVCLGLLSSVSVVGAATFSWNNASGGTFSVGSNWTPVGPPTTAADVADFNLNSIYTVTVGSPASIGSLNFTAGLVSVQLLGSGTSLHVAGQVLLTSSATISFGTFSCGSLTIQNSARFTSQIPTGPITGQVTLNGGTYSGNYSPGVFLPGTFTMNSGTASINGLFLGQNHPATFIQSAGVASLQSLSIGAFNPVGGSYFLNGGSVVNNATRIGGVSAGTFTHTSGTHQAGTLVMGAGGLYTQSGGYLNVLNSFSIDSGSTLTLSGGSIQFNNTTGTMFVRGTLSQTGAGTLAVANSATLSVEGASAVASFAQTPTFESNRTLAVVSGGSFTGQTPLNLGINGSGGRLIVNGVGSRLSIAGNCSWGTLGVATITLADSAAGTVNGSVTLGTGTASIGTIDLSAGAALHLSGLSIAPGSRANITNAMLHSTGPISLGGQINLVGGTLRSTELNPGGGGLAWSTGSLHLTSGGITIGGAGLLPANLLLDASRTLTVGGTTTINTGARLMLDNSVFSTGGVINNGTLTLISGTVNITGPSGLTVGPGVGVGSVLTLTRGVTLNVSNQLSVQSGGTVDVVGTSLLMGSGANAGKMNIVDSTINFGAGVTNTGTLNIVDSTVSGLVNGPTGSSLNIGGRTRLNAHTSAHRTGRLSISADAQLDLTTGGLVVDYTSSSPLAGITQLIVTGFAGGGWTGQGITSSAAAAQANRGLGVSEASGIGSPATFMGQEIDSTTVLLRYTILGDADLSGTTDIDDFGRLATSFNQPGAWHTGDFNYDGTTDIDDFGLLAVNFNQSVPAFGLARPVPEPGAAVGAVLALTTRRQRRRATA